MGANELYFLRRELPVELRHGYRWSLTKVKLQKEGAYLVFRTRELAGRVIQHFKGHEVVAASELNNEHHYDFSQSLVVLFESESDVEAYLANRGEYRLGKHLHRYSLENGPSKLAV